jgi:hypothetical protein
MNYFNAYPGEPAMDEPTLLSRVPDRLVQLHENCPDCGHESLAGFYEASTNNVHSPYCIRIECDYNED